MTRFYGYFRSSAAWRCRIAFNLKGIAPETVFVHLRKGEQKADGFRAINPQALLPALETDEGVLTQSLAIIEWLDETHPTPALLPRDPFRRAQVRSFAQVIACDIHPLQNLRVLEYLRKEYGQDEAGVQRWCQRWLGDGLAACEALLARHQGDAPFCFGDRPSLADICLAPQMASAQRFGVDTSGFTRLNRVMAQCNALAAFQEAHASRQPDSEV